MPLICKAGVTVPHRKQGVCLPVREAASGAGLEHRRRGVGQQRNAGAQRLPRHVARLQGLRLHLGDDQLQRDESVFIVDVARLRQDFRGVKSFLTTVRPLTAGSDSRSREYA